MSEPCQLQDESSYWNFSIPRFSLAIGGNYIRTSIAERLNQFRGYRDECSSEVGSNNIDTGSAKNDSLFNLAISVFTDLKGRVEQVCLRISSPSFFQSNNDQGSSSDRSGKAEEYDRPCKESMEESTQSKCEHPHHLLHDRWEHPRHVRWTHVPPKIQESYIESGYLLPFMPWRYYLKALYTPSIELMNIWTHLIPSIYFMYLLFAFKNEMDIREAWPLFTITLCASIVTGLSALAHMFHSRSSLHHSCWFMVDYFGITVYAFATILCNFYSGSLLQYYKALSGCYPHVATLFCFAGFLGLSLTQTKCKLASYLASHVKLSVNAFGYIFGALPLFQRIFFNTLDGRQEQALWYHGFAMVNLIAASLFFKSDVPQKYWPGKFNIFGHSHQIFHVFTAVSAYCVINGVYYDVTGGPWKIIHEQDDYPTLEEIVTYYGFLLIFSICAMVVIRHVISKDHLHEEPFLREEKRCVCGLPSVTHFPEKHENFPNRFIFEKDISAKKNQ